MKLRKLARGQDCQARIPNICNFNNETTVLAHVKIKGDGAVGRKPHDLHGAWCCSSCHDELDGRTRHLERNDVYLMALEAVFRTQKELIKRGLL